MARAARGGNAAPARKRTAATQTGDDASPAPTSPAAERDDAGVTRFVEDLASALMEMGVPRMPARVFAALLTTDSGRLTAAELDTKLQISPAAVSGAVRYLVQIGMARRESEAGSRRHYYRGAHHVW